MQVATRLLEFFSFKTSTGAVKSGKVGLEASLESLEKRDQAGELLLLKALMIRP